MDYGSVSEIITYTREYESIEGLDKKFHVTWDQIDQQYPLEFLLFMGKNDKGKFCRKYNAGMIPQLAVEK